MHWLGSLQNGQSRNVDPQVTVLHWLVSFQYDQSRDIIIGDGSILPSWDQPVWSVHLSCGAGFSVVDPKHSSQNLTAVRVDNITVWGPSHMGSGWQDYIFWPKQFPDLNEWIRSLKFVGIFPVPNHGYLEWLFSKLAPVSLELILLVYRDHL